MLPVLVGLVLLGACIGILRWWLGWKAALMGVLVLSLPIAEGMARISLREPLYFYRMSLKGWQVEVVDQVPLWRSNKAVRYTQKDYYRMARLAKNPQPEAWTVVGVGDSVAYGIGLRKNQTYLAQLPEYLKPKDGRPVNTINFSVPAYNSEQEKTLFLAKGEPLRPNLVLVHIWEDDLKKNMVFGNEVYSSGLDVSPDLGLPLLTGILGWLMPRSRLVQAISLQRAGGAGDPNCSARDLALNSLTALNQSAAAFGGKAVFLLSPDLSGEMPAQPQAYGAVKSHLAAQNATIIDLSDLLKGNNSRDIRLDDCCHFNEKGHQLLAEKLGEILGSILDDGKMPGDRTR